MNGVWVVVRCLPSVREFRGIQQQIRKREVMFLLRDWMSRGDNEILWLTN